LYGKNKRKAVAFNFEDLRFFL
jgi:hypothetical protein